MCQSLREHEQNNLPELLQNLTSSFDLIFIVYCLLFYYCNQWLNYISSFQIFFTYEFIYSSIRGMANEAKLSRVEKRER